MAHKYFGHSVYIEGDTERGLALLLNKRNYVFSTKLFRRDGPFLLIGGAGFVSFQLVLASNVWMESLFGPDIEKWMRNVTLTYSDPRQI